MSGPGAGALGIGSVALVGLMLLAGCGPKTEEEAATPEQTCSAQATYDELTGIIAAQAGQAVSLLSDTGDDVAAAAAAKAIGANLSYSSPTVEEVNKDTRKISCAALLTVSAPPRLLNSNSLAVNDLAADRVTYRIAYSVQPSADGGRAVYTLQQANDLSVVALTASLIALRKTQAAADISRLDADALNAAAPDDDDGTMTTGADAENAAGDDQAQPPEPANQTSEPMPGEPSNADDT